MTELGLNLDQTILSAVKARIEAEVVRAMSGDELLGTFVTAALQQEVQVGDPYNRKKIPFLTHVLQEAIREAAQAAVRKFVADEVESIEAEVRAALTRDVAAIATSLSQSLVQAADKPYGVSVTVELTMPRSGF